MASIDETIETIRRRAGMHQLSRRRLAYKAGLHPNTLLLLGLPTWNPKVETLRKLAAALDALDREAGLGPASHS
jgi:transcriptional regulator with XRE-family HTH domain